MQDTRLEIYPGDIRLLVERQSTGNMCYVKNASLKELGIDSAFFSAEEDLVLNTPLIFSLQFKRHHLDIEIIVEKSSRQDNIIDDKSAIHYIVRIDKDDREEVKAFLENYVNGISYEKAHTILTAYFLTSNKEQKNICEIFSSMVFFFSKIETYEGKKTVVVSILEEVIYMLDAEGATVYSINTENECLEVYSSLDPKDVLLDANDQQQGHVEKAFTTRSPSYCEKKSFIAHPFFNKEGESIGVVKISRRRGSKDFSENDEWIIKLLCLVLSSLFRDSASSCKDTINSLPIDMKIACDNKLSLKKKLSFIEKEIILQEIKRQHGNKSLAARKIGISREALRKKLHKTAA